MGNKEMPGSDRKVGGRLLRLYQGMFWGPILLNVFISDFGSESRDS